MLAPAGARPRPQDRRARAALIAEHLEPEVVEVRQHGALALTQDSRPADPGGARTEVSGETVFFILRSVPAAGRAAAALHLRTAPAWLNLEDLFLKLTGRQIRRGWLSAPERS